jgi:glyoxylase-like metal-dependent hydrolase (beta-lactamase superfamily II)/rhodanese-related sulfurtransferase
MYFKQILNERCGCASYVIACQTREAVIVDPAIDIQEYESLLQARNLKLRYVIDTHVHADHVSGARLLAKKYGAELCMYEDAKVAYPFRPLQNGEELSVGQLRLKVVHTPGHRSELISLLVTNPQRSPEPSMVLTGDSLLVGDVGRPDFGGGDASQQYDSVSRLLRLPDWVAVFPGHFEGPCGKGMCGRPSTTIGFERLFNPMARLERPRFVETLSTEVPPRPLNMAAIEATNRGTADMPWAMLTTDARVKEVPIEVVEARAPEAVVLDVREPEEYAQGHIPGAVNLPQAELATRLNEVPKDRPVYVVCLAGMRSVRVSQFLAQMGYANAASVAGGTEAWREAGKPLDTGDVQAAPPNYIVESLWTHGGGYTFEI